MPVRTALNVCYALMVKDLDPKQRRDIDDDIHGWTAQNERATDALINGGES